MKDGVPTRERDVDDWREAGEWLENQRDGDESSRETPPARPGPVSAEIHSSTLGGKKASSLAPLSADGAGSTSDAPGPGLMFIVRPLKWAAE